MADPTRRYQRVAHRGASKELRENTLPAFKVALDRGADAIELDVHLTRDGVVVVHHDEHVAGYSIADEGWAAVSQVPLPGGARIPRLEDVLTAVGDRAEVYIELKGLGVGGPAIDVAKRFGKRFAVHSFDHGAVEAAMRYAPDVARGVLLDRGTPDPVAAMKAAHKRVAPRDVWPHFSLVDAAFMQAATELSARVVVWTVNSADDAARLIKLGVAGICTDDVRLLEKL